MYGDDDDDDNCSSTTTTKNINNTVYGMVFKPLGQMTLKLLKNVQFPNKRNSQIQVCSLCQV